MQEMNMEKKKFNNISRVLGLLTAVVLVISVFAVTNTAVFDIPVFGIVLGESEVENYKEQTRASSDQLKEHLENVSEEEINEIEEAFDMEIDELIDELSQPSLNGTIKLVEKMTEMDEELLGEEVVSIDEEITSVLNLFRNIIFGYAAFILLFVLLGIIFAKKAFPILAIIFASLYFIFLAGIILYAAFIVLAIVQMVFMSKAKKA